jgi:hypothetical protein
MKRFVSFLLFFLSLTLFGQNPPIRETTTEQPKEKGDIIKIQDYFPVSMEDPKISVTEVSVDRRFSPDGKGEILDIFFNIDNNTSERIDLFVWVIAYYETDAVEKEERRIVPYPTWRVYDPDKRTYLTRFIKITPKDIPIDKIWNPEDPDYQKYHNVIKRMRNVVGNLKVIGDVYPPVWKYVSYIMRYPTQGVPTIMYGDLGPTPDKLLFTNFIPPTPEEKRTKIFKHIPDHTFTINYNRRRTIFRSHHYSDYRADYYFFNTFRILIFDANKAKQFEEQANRELKQGEKPIDALMYHRIFFINREMKIR